IDFGDVSIGETATRTITISETGTNTITVSVPGTGLITGEHAADFSITVGSPPFSIPDGGAAVTITIQCEPAASDVRTAILTLASNDPTQPTLTYTLTCNGIQLLIGDVTITRLDIFGDDVISGVVGQVTQVKGLALRSGPYLGASMLGVIRPDRDYLILAYNDTEGNANGQGPYPWFLLIDTFNNDRIGWASGRYLQVNSPVPFQDTTFDTAASAPYNRVELVIRGNSNVRLRPSERSREITAPTDYGVTVRAYARTVQAGLTQWILIEYQGQRGWIRYNPITMEVAEPALYGLDALRIW
ncbi:MAG: choice-of-anchor D domain-containing protein, partial [Aggregatilineales bacterium]